MSFDSRSLLRRLQELQLQIAATPQHGESLRGALDGHDLGEAICATIDAERHVLAMAATIADIQAQVVPTDDLGAVESLSELVFRAVRMVVLTELSMLREVVLYWFGVNVTVLGEVYRNRSMGKRGSCGRLVALGAAKATHLAGGLKPGIARRPDCRATTSEAVGRRDVADRAV
jgi:hypothetical protein